MRDLRINLSTYGGILIVGGWALIDGLVGTATHQADWHIIQAIGGAAVAWAAFSRIIQAAENHARRMGGVNDESAPR